jgi:hypothetical protein
MVSKHWKIRWWFPLVALGLTLPGDFDLLSEPLDRTFSWVAAAILLACTAGFWWEERRRRQADQSSSAAISPSDQT